MNSTYTHRGGRVSCRGGQPAVSNETISGTARGERHTLAVYDLVPCSRVFDAVTKRLQSEVTLSPSTARSKPRGNEESLTQEDKSTGGLALPATPPERPRAPTGFSPVSMVSGGIANLKLPTQRCSAAVGFPRL